jgi:hypothetical protein
MSTPCPLLYLSLFSLPSLYSHTFIQTSILQNTHTQQIPRSPYWCTNYPPNTTTHTKPHSQRPCSLPTPSGSSFSRSPSPLPPFPTLNQTPLPRRSQDVESADNLAERSSVKHSPSQKRSQDVESVDNLAEKPSVHLLQDVVSAASRVERLREPLRPLPMLSPSPPPSPRKIVSSLAMPDNLLETSPPLSPRLKMTPRHSGPLSLSETIPTSISEMPLHDVEREASLVARPSVKQTLRLRHDAEKEANPVASFVALPRLLPKLSLSLSQRHDVESEDNLVVRPREMLLPWPMQQTSFFLLFKSTNLQLGSSKLTLPSSSNDLISNKTYPGFSRIALLHFKLFASSTATSHW